MGILFPDSDTGSRRVVVMKQENRSLSSGLSSSSNIASSGSKKKSFQRGRYRKVLLPLLLSAVVLAGASVWIIYRTQNIRHDDNVHGDGDEQQEEQTAFLPSEHDKKDTKQNELKMHQAQQLERKRQADVARLVARSKEESQSKGGGTTLVLTTTSLGRIRIQLRPDLSEGSVDYIYRLVKSKNHCPNCNFYRSEQHGILQGIMANENQVPTNTVLGNCPPGAESIENECPEEWDPDCGCHGPMMTRGSVAWAAGDPGGPDFFINAYEGPAEWWGTQHTNFGFIDDPASMAIVDQILHLPVVEENGMHYLKEAVHFQISLE